MKLKEQFKNKIITRKFNGRTVTFDTRNTDTSKNKFYSEVGFSDCFETILETPETPKKKSSKRSLKENDIVEPIVEESPLEDINDTNKEEE